MEKNHKIIIGVLIVIIAVLACLIAVFTLMPQEQPDNVIKIEGITFNTTNATNFTQDKKHNTEDSNFIQTCYRNNENGSWGKYTVYITQFFDKNTYQMAMSEFKKADDPVSIINGKEIYLKNAEMGDYVGEPRYYSTVYNADLNKCVIISTPDANETAKIASTLKFN